MGRKSNSQDVESSNASKVLKSSRPLFLHSPDIKVIPTVSMGCKGIIRRYGVIIDGIPRYEYTLEELEAFLRGLNGTA